MGKKVVAAESERLATLLRYARGQKLVKQS
jgi:hypothetical protein